MADRGARVHFVVTIIPLEASAVTDWADWGRAQAYRRTWPEAQAAIAMGPNQS